MNFEGSGDMLTELLFLCLHTAAMALRVQHSGTFPPPLTASEESEYVAKAAAGDTEAREILIEHNLRLVAHIVKKYISPGVDSDDLISIGTIGLIKAVATFTPEKGEKLATYTALCIENEILMYFRASRKSRGDISLSEPIDSDGDGNTLELEDVISVEDDLAEQADANIQASALKKAISQTLDSREQQVISLRYGVPGGRKTYTQRETAEVMGISRSYVSRLEKKALEKLRGVMERHR